MSPGLEVTPAGQSPRTRGRRTLVSPGGKRKCAYLSAMSSFGSDHASPTTDHFAALPGGRRDAAAQADVLLVEDHGGFNHGPSLVAVLATRNPELAEDVAAVHRHVAQLSVARATPS
jgi:hypothetical protein